MSRARVVGSLLAIGMMATGSVVAFGQTYPSHAIQLVTGPAGGGGDLAARVIAQDLPAQLGQPVVVINKPDAAIPEYVATAPADGYTIGLLGNSAWLGPLFQKRDYDPIRDFIPVSLVNRAANVLVVNPSLPVKSVAELIALAKSEPGKLNYAGASGAAASTVAAELFKSMAGVDIKQVNYNGGAAAVVSLLGNETQMRFDATLGQYIKAGKLRALAVTSAQPSDLNPGLPTISETLPGYRSETVQAVFAPAKTPAAIIDRLNAAVVAVLRQPNVKDGYNKTGSDPAPTSSADALAYIKSDMAAIAPLAKAASSQR